MTFTNNSSKTLNSDKIYQVFIIQKVIFCPKGSLLLNVFYHINRKLSYFRVKCKPYIMLKR